MNAQNATLPRPAFERASQFSALAATLCAVHCAATPIAAAAVPILAVAEAAEWWAFVATVAVGGVVVALGPARHRRGVVALLSLGAAAWTSSLLGYFAPVPEAVTSPLGSIVFASGMVWSARVCRSGECERCEVRERDPEAAR